MAAVFADTDAETTLPMRLLQIGEASPSVVAAAVRGLIATPWFAAATGFVVAAGLWIYSPHAELKFPASFPGSQQCSASSCVGSGQGATNGQTGQGGGTSAATAASQATTMRRLKFTSTVIWESRGSFAVRITVVGRRAPLQWRLVLRMRGDRIFAVSGANLVSSSAGSLVVTGPADSSSGQWQGPGPGGDPGQVVSVPPRRGFTFIIYGDGTRVTPTYCSLDGVRCTFSASP
jgi:hypothetical protein